MKINYLNIGMQANWDEYVVIQAEFFLMQTHDEKDLSGETYHLGEMSHLMWIAPKL